MLLSGDCPAALGAVAGLQRRYQDVAVVWLDAHGDFNTPAITISGYLGGMPLAMLSGRAPELFCDALGLRPVADTSVVLADARDLDPAERDALAASQVRRVPADPAAITSALDGLGRTPVYLHLDVDVIDSAQLPGLRFPSGPGPSVAQIEECLAAVRATADVEPPASPAPGFPITSATRPPARRSPGSPERSAPTWHGPNPPAADRSTRHSPPARAERRRAVHGRRPACCARGSRT